jgi:hypothetical protein
MERKITNNLLILMKQAEDMGGFRTGEQKKAFVIKNLKLIKGIKPEHIYLADAMIDVIISVDKRQLKIATKSIFHK